MFVTGTSAVGIEVELFLVLELEEVFLELRQLSRAAQRVGVDDERRQDLGVALPLVDVEHEVHQRAAELRRGAVENRETRAGDLRGAIEVDDAELLAEVRVLLRL